MTALLHISWRMQEWKNFENRPVFDKVMCWEFGGYFFWPTPYVHRHPHTQTATAS